MVEKTPVLGRTKIKIWPEVVTVWTHTQEICVIWTVSTENQFQQLRNLTLNKNKLKSEITRPTMCTLWPLDPFIYCSQTWVGSTGSDETAFLFLASGADQVSRPCPILHLTYPVKGPTLNAGLFSWDLAQAPFPAFIITPTSPSPPSPLSLWHTFLEIWVYYRLL